MTKNFNDFTDFIDFVNEKRLENYKLIIYGAGKASKKFIRLIKLLKLENLFEINYIIDKDSKKHGNLIEGIEVVDLEKIADYNQKYCVIYTISEDFLNKVEIDVESKLQEYLIISIDKLFRNDNVMLDLIFCKLRKDNKSLDSIYNEMFYNRVIEDINIDLFYDNGFIKMKDVSSDCFNIIEGRRIVSGYTKDNKYINRIYFFGDSRFLSNKCIDEHTIQSFLQKKLKDNYKIEDYSRLGSNVFLNIELIKSLDLNSGDFVILNNANIPEVTQKLNYNDSELAIMYAKEIIEVKGYLAKLDVEFIFVYLPRLYEKKIYGEYENKLIEISEYLELTNYNYMYTYFRKVKEILNEIGTNVCDISDIFNYLNYDIFFDFTHFSPKGNNIVATELWKKINIFHEQKNSLNDVLKLNRQLEKQERIEKYVQLDGLSEYIQKLKKISFDKKGVGGAIVLNANPFTNGHKYLVEKAAEQVDYLFLFVVEEDKSFFKFEDRYSLVKKGTSHLENIVIVPSGKGVISSLTLPGYFSKETDTEQVLDASNDIAIFGNLIAPACRITKRFVGNEPFCKITNQYNQQMQKLLGKYDIELIVIDRVGTIDDEIISATKVRKYLKEKDFETLSRYVPQTTLEYLVSKYR